MQQRRELTEAATDLYAEPRKVVEELATHLPEGINGLEFYSDGGRPAVKVDSTSNEHLDPFIEKLNTELASVDFKLGDHIRMGFTDDEQFDGWYVVRANEQTQDDVVDKW